MSESGSERKVAVLVLACVSPPYDRLIDTIRRTWGSHHTKSTSVYYVYGNPEAGDPSDELSRFVTEDLPRVDAGDMQQIGDVLIAGCADSINAQEDCLLQKRLIAFHHLCEQGDYDFVYTVCAASYVDLDKLRTYVDSMPRRGAAAGPVSIDPTATAPFVSGSSMLLTADVASALARDRDNIIRNNEFGFRDDVTIGQWIARNLSQVPIDRVVKDIQDGARMTREHVFISAPQTSAGFVLAPPEDQRPSAEAYHYHFHSRKPDHMEGFHDQFFTANKPGSGERSNNIANVQIFGERSSGTNYLTRLIEKNFAHVEPTQSFGFKHWFIKDHHPRGRPNRSTDFECVRRLDDSDDTLFIIIHRNPFDWLRSIHATPDHAPGHWNLSFSEFIRKPWLATVPDRANPLWPEEEQGDYFIEEAENIIRLRSQKARHFLNLEGSVANLVFLKYEALLADIGVLEGVADEFGIPVQNRPLQNETFYFGGGEEKVFSDANEYPPISPDDLGFIGQNLDWELEASLGYGWADLRPTIASESSPNST